MALFAVLWSTRHWGAAMELASLAVTGGDQAPGTHWPRLVAPIKRRGWTVLLVLAVISTMLLPVLDLEAVADDCVCADRVYGDAAWRRRSSFFVPALGFASGFAHYLLDRAAFRFALPRCDWPLAACYGKGLSANPASALWREMTIILAEQHFAG